MSKKNKVRFGLENLHIAPIKVVDGEVTFESPIHIPGAVNFVANPDGSDVEFYADNIKYYHREVNNGYTGSIETALFSNETKALMLGWEIDENGALVEVTDGTPTPFALLAQVKGDQQEGRFVYYNCQAGRPNHESETQGETATPKTETAPLEILPIKLAGKNLVKAVVEQDSAAYDSFFDEVYIPEFVPEG